MRSFLLLVGVWSPLVLATETGPFQCGVDAPDKVYFELRDIGRRFEVRLRETFDAKQVSSSFVWGLGNKKLVDKHRYEVSWNFAKNSDRVNERSLVCRYGKTDKRMVACSSRVNSDATVRDLGGGEDGNSIPLVAFTLSSDLNREEIASGFQEMKAQDKLIFKLHLTGRGQRANAWSDIDCATGKRVGTPVKGRSPYYPSYRDRVDDDDESYGDGDYDY